MPGVRNRAGHSMGSDEPILAKVCYPTKCYLDHESIICDEETELPLSAKCSTHECVVAREAWQRLAMKRGCDSL